MTIINGSARNFEFPPKPNTREVIIMRKYYLNKLKSTCSKLEREALRTLIELCNWRY
ncbi:hypothetical protein VCR6J2_220309 [Vibrio coralliirubri]|nr:hypothetical protein VCR6J2_220309 [Vibrio coralliirubri]CDU14049.1 hypothetical protein VCR17J2_610068 [Vibrio coralliirubri]